MLKYCQKNAKNFKVATENIFFNSKIWICTGSLSLSHTLLSIIHLQFVVWSDKFIWRHDTIFQSVEFRSGYQLKSFHQCRTKTTDCATSDYFFHHFHYFLDDTRHLSCFCFQRFFFTNSMLIFVDFFRMVMVEYDINSS